MKTDSPTWCGMPGCRINYPHAHEGIERPFDDRDAEIADLGRRLDQAKKDRYEAAKLLAAALDATTPRSEWIIQARNFILAANMEI